MTDTYRPCNSRELVQQIGLGNLLAISGGRVIHRETGITLPVAHGYSVEIDLRWDDVWTVKRIYKRGAKVWIKGEQEAYADEVSETAYRASCYHHSFAS